MEDKTIGLVFPAAKKPKEPPKATPEKKPKEPPKDKE